METKHLHRHVGRVVHALMLAVLFLWGGNVTASALEGSGTIDDPYVLENGTTFDVNYYQTWYGKFTAPSDGTFTILGNYSVYTDSDFTTEADVKSEWTKTFPQCYAFYCKQGVTYYIKQYAQNRGTVEVSFAGSGEILPIELTGVSPEGNGTLNVSTGTVSLTFNQGVSIASATMTVGDKSETFSVNAYASFASVDLKKKMAEWYNDGTLYAGADITIVFNGITASGNSDVKYGEDGTLTLTYKAGAKPMMLIETTNTPDQQPTFYSYYMSDDKAGTVTLVFDGEVVASETEIGGVTEKSPKALLMYGNQEIETDYYQEELPVKIFTDFNGNSTLIVDLKDKVRRATDMLPNAGSAYENISLRISGVRDAEGNYAYSDQQGSVGSYTYTYNYKEVSYTPMGRWTPAGEITQETGNIVLSLQETGGNAAFSGAHIKYISGGEEQNTDVAVTSVVASGVANGRNITIPLAGITADAGSEITVSLNNVERPDGLTDDASMALFSKTFTTTGIEAEGMKITTANLYEVTLNEKGEVVSSNTIFESLDKQSIDVLKKTYRTDIKTNMDSKIGYVTWELRGPAAAPDGGYMRTGYAGRGTFGTFTDEGFTIEWGGYEKLLSPYEYTFTLTGYASYEDYNRGAEPIGTATFTINGSAEEYQYSTVKMLTPIGDDITLLGASDNYRTFEFSDKVTLTAIANLGQGQTEECNIEAVDNTDGEYSDSWKITIPTSVLSSYELFDINIFVKDQDGKAVNTTADGKGVIMGSEANTWFEVHFVSEFNKPDLTVSPADGEVESISRIEFSYAEGVGLSYYDVEPITILDKINRTIIRTISMDEVMQESINEDKSYCYIVLNEPITEVGSYEIVIPANFFILGNGMTTTTNKKTSVSYAIKGAVVPSDIKVDADPAVGTVTALPVEIKLTFTEMNEVALEKIESATLVDGNGKSYPINIDFDWSSWDVFNVLIVTLKDGTAITANGTYTLTIPENALSFNGEPTNVNDAPIVLTWTIGTSTGIDSIVANAGGKVNVYNVNGMLVLRDADAAAVKTLAKGLYIINGKKVVIK